MKKGKFLGIACFHTSVICMIMYSCWELLKYPILVQCLKQYNSKFYNKLSQDIIDFWLCGTYEKKITNIDFVPALYHNITLQVLFLMLSPASVGSQDPTNAVFLTPLKKPLPFRVHLLVLLCVLWEISLHSITQIPINMAKYGEK